MLRNRTMLIAMVATLVVAVGVVGWFVVRQFFISPANPAPAPEAATPQVEPVPVVTTEIIGQSVEGRQIEVYRIGTGQRDVLFVGGIHGGYEWNSALLAWEMIDHFTADTALIPDDVTLHIIPVLNPDGLAAVVGTSSRFTLAMVPSPSERVAAGRFNANGVDLNRNFDCNWEPESMWRGAVVSAGSAPFSEPEAAAFRDYVLRTQPKAAAFWHSQADTVYGSACSDGVLPLTSTLGASYAEAANYGFVELFDAYPITGDVEGWLASIGIPAVTIELESFSRSEQERNLAGVMTWLGYFGEADSIAR